MMLLSAIAAVLLAAVAKRRIGAARPKYARARPGSSRRQRGSADEATHADYNRRLRSGRRERLRNDRRRRSRRGFWRTPAAGLASHQFSGRGICESYPSARTARTCPASMIGATTTTPGPWQFAIADENIVVMNCIPEKRRGRSRGCPDCRGQTPLLGLRAGQDCRFLLARGAAANG